MTKPLLHARVRRTIDSNLSLEQLKHELELIASKLDGVQIIFEALDSDAIAFEIDRGDLLLSGGFQRWQGTGSRLDILGEVLVPELSNRSRYVIVTAFPLICSVIYFGAYFVAGTGMSFVCIVVPIWIGMITTLWWTAEKFVPSDVNQRRRWHVQQELAAVLSDMEARIKSS